MGCVPGEQDSDDLAVRDFYNDHATNVIGKNDCAMDRYQLEERKEISEEMFEAVDQSGGEEFMAIKPWIGALVAPSSPPPFKRGPPSAELSVEFCNGYRTEDCRSNLYFVDSNTILYPAACLGVVQDITTRKQKFYGGGPSKTNDKHKDDIISLAFSSDKKTVATGSIGANPQIFVWDVKSRTTVGAFKLGRNTRAVAVMCFSPDGLTIFLGDKADQHNVYAYGLNGTLLAKAKTGSDNLNDCAALPGSFGTASKDGFLLFQFSGSALNKRRGTGAGSTPMTCVGASNGKYYVGGLDGSMFVFEGNNCTKSVKAHSKATMAVAGFQDCVITSGSDNQLVVWSNELQKLRTVELPTFCKAIDKLKDTLLVGTRMGQILTIDAAGQQTQLMKTHWSGEVWGLCQCPLTGLVVTTGDDNDVLAFDLKTYKVVARATVSNVPGTRKKIGGASTLSLLPPNQQSRAVAISKKTGHVALGTNTGGLIVRKGAKELAAEVFSNLSLAKEWIEVMKYCPKGENLAVGSHDNNIYILNSAYERVAVCSKHNSFITNLDWSCDGSKLQSNCGAYEYLFFDASSGKQLTSGASMLRDERWDTYSVKLGWWVQGIFPPATSGDFVNSCVRSGKGDLILTGDDNGELRLFENPALKGAVGKGYKAHSSHVVRSHFTPDDRSVLSVGGFDKCLIIWKRT